MEYVQGRDALSQLGDQVAPIAETALVIGDSDVLGIIGDRAEASLEESDVDVTLEEFGGEASETEIDRITEVAREIDADVIVGAGGGKGLDTAKAVRENAGGAMVSMPTIASTDAPTSSLSVIYSEDGEFERYRFYESHPDVVLV
ncbi:iron-containing alcohol dehydrogenase, partial [Natrialba taiwanensis]